jgi:hypothetical protein
MVDYSEPLLTHRNIAQRSVAALDKDCRHARRYAGPMGSKFPPGQAPSNTGGGMSTIETINLVTTDGGYDTGDALRVRVRDALASVSRKPGPPLEGGRLRV